MGLREENKLEKEERILRAARELFAERGFEGTTTRAIAERARVAKGTVFVYLPSKSATLVQLWADDIVKQIEEAERAAMDAPTLEEWLVEVFGRFIRFYLREPELSRVYLREVVFSPVRDELVYEFADTINESFLEGVRGQVERAQERGEVDPALDSRECAHHVFAAYMLVLIGALRGIPRPEHIDETLRRAFRRTLDGFRSRSFRQPAPSPTPGSSGGET